MSPATSSEPVDLAHARALRLLARELHPDRGGDPTVYVEAVAALEARHRLELARRTHADAAPLDAVRGAAIRPRSALARHTRRLRHRWRRRSGSRWIEL